MENPTNANNANNSIATTCKLSSLELEQLLVGLMAEAKIRFPHPPLTDMEARLYLVDWLEMAREYGAERFTAGVRAAFRHLKFFPRPAEIVELIPELPPAATFEPPTWQEIQQRGSEEQREDYQQLKVVVDGVKNLAGKKNLARPYLPTNTELTGELEETRELRERLKQVKPERK